MAIKWLGEVMIMMNVLKTRDFIKNISIDSCSFQAHMVSFQKHQLGFLATESITFVFSTAKLTFNTYHYQIKCFSINMQSHIIVMLVKHA